MLSVVCSNLLANRVCRLRIGTDFVGLEDDEATAFLEAETEVCLPLADSMLFAVICRTLSRVVLAVPCPCSLLGCVCCLLPHTQLVLLLLVLPQKAQAALAAARTEVESIVKQQGVRL